MVPPKLNIRSILRKESLESQQKHAPRNRFLRTVLCSNDILNPGYNRKMLIRKKIFLLDGVCFFMNSCFIQYNAPLVEYINVA